MLPLLPPPLLLRLRLRLLLCHGLAWQVARSGVLHLRPLPISPEACPRPDPHLSLQAAPPASAPASRSWAAARALRLLWCCPPSRSGLRMQSCSQSGSASGRWALNGAVSGVEWFRLRV